MATVGVSVSHSYHTLIVETTVRPPPVGVVSVETNPTRSYPSRTAMFIVLYFKAMFIVL